MTINNGTTRFRGGVLCALAITIVAGGASAIVASTPAAQESRHVRRPNIVLVHGAWADASSWSGVIQRLQKAGYHVAAVQLDLTTLSDDVAKTREVLSAQDGPTLLVAHSFGGVVISALGVNAPHVIGLVYESAFAPDQGETMKAIATQPPQPASAAAVRPDERGYLWLSADGFLKFFAPDVKREQARVLAAVQKPIAMAEFMSEEKFGQPAWRTFPTWYIVTENDQMISPEVQRVFARRMGAKVSSIAGSHVAMISHPEEVANVIMRASQSATGSSVR